MLDISISGYSMVTSLGDNRRTTFEALCQGASGNKPLQAFDTTKFSIQHAHEILDRDGSGSDTPQRASVWLSKAISDAMEDAKITADSGRVVILVGTGLRELRSLELWWADGAAIEPSVLHFGEGIRESLESNIQVMTFSNACSASSYALGVGADLITLDQADVVVVAGVDTLTESMLGLLGRVNPTPPTRIQPFESTRRGVLMGEGASAVVLEKSNRAKERGIDGAPQLRSVALNCDAYHETAPDVEGITKAMRMAHQQADLQCTDVDLIMVHGTGTHANDLAEATAISQLYQDTESRPYLSAIKSMTGHTSGASGLVGLVTAIESLHSGSVPPNIGLDTPIDEARDLNLPTSTTFAPLRVAQINAFGFGGVNAVAIVERGCNANH